MLPADTQQAVYSVHRCEIGQELNFFFQLFFIILHTATPSHFQVHHQEKPIRTYCLFVCIISISIIYLEETAKTHKRQCFWTELKEAVMQAR